MIKFHLKRYKINRVIEPQTSVKLIEGMELLERWKIFSQIL